MVGELLDYSALAQRYFGWAQEQIRLAETASDHITKIGHTVLAERYLVLAEQELLAAEHEVPH
jgi:hypothetical protein